MVLIIYLINYANYVKDVPCPITQVKKEMGPYGEESIKRGRKRCRMAEVVDVKEEQDETFQRELENMSTEDLVSYRSHLKQMLKSVEARVAYINS